MTLFNVLFYLNSFGLNEVDRKPWATTEHLETGNKLDLYYCSSSVTVCNINNAMTIKAADKLLKLDNGLELTFGEIVSFAGDYFADSDNPITGGLYDNLIAIPENQFENPVEVVSQENLLVLAENFKNTFMTLSSNWNAERIVNLVYKYINGDLSLDEVIQLGLRRYDLAVNNFDHFSPYSWYAYSIGHSIALKFAAEAGKTKKQDDLNYAYAIEAFAQHFLTDTFASGHIRVPLKSIRRFALFEKNALLLTKFMHDEDTKFGVNLYNLNGDHWRAYGDSYYNDARNKKNITQLQKTQQLAIKQVYDAYLQASDKLDFDNYFIQMRKNIPIINNNNRVFEQPQNYPLFSADSNDNIYRRGDLNTLQDSNTKVLSQFGAITILINKLFTYDPH